MNSPSRTPKRERPSLYSAAGRRSPHVPRLFTKREVPPLTPPSTLRKGTKARQPLACLFTTPTSQANTGLLTPRTTPRSPRYKAVPRHSTAPTTPPTPSPEVSRPPRLPRDLTVSELQGHVESLISELRLNSQSETTLTQAKRNDLYLAEYQRLLTAQEKALDRHSKYVYRHVVDLATSHCDGSAYRDLLLAFDSWEAAEDDWTLLTWRVHLGVSRRCVTVPCMFWSSEVAFHAAARNLANIRGSREAIYRATARLRSALRDVGAFVGWLPMDVGCAMDSRLTGSMRVYEDGARSSPSQTLRRSTSSAYLSVTDTRGAEREALSWSHPIRHDTPRRQQRDDGYRESYQILGPDAAFLLYDFDRRVISFDSEYDGFLGSKAKTRKRWSRVASTLDHRGETFMLYALGSPRAFDSADGDPWHGRLHGMVVDAGLKTPPLAVWLESQVHALAVRARHW